ncbi:hypothetical protein HQ865_10895 [Mucilaginibacter mali]|uniref:Uncharacterized protein n=1 Tax=Mucilaginibacter mali TaxID=2740462 RepID=A0A7D4QSU5_9SPHI|nr:hypothetical protein [Mucilaginibacter mali]QKJ30249.1 hypothetical protein HQ865_10895 [Mucilaginibacter mali]
MKPGSMLECLSPDVLADIKSKLAPYHTAFCGLKHEQVTEVYSDENGDYFKRYGFCDKAARKYRLGCAHTSANDEFCRIILSACEQFPGAQALAEHFGELFLNVYMMDLTKGALEKQLALGMRIDNKLLIADAKAAIAEVIKTHHQLVRAIEELRIELMNRLRS